MSGNTNDRLRELGVVLGEGISPENDLSRSDEQVLLEALALAYRIGREEEHQRQRTAEPERHSPLRSGECACGFTWLDGRRESGLAAHDGEQAPSSTQANDDGSGPIETRAALTADERTIWRHAFVDGGRWVSSGAAARAHADHVVQLYREEPLPETKSRGQQSTHLRDLRAAAVWRVQSGHDRECHKCKKKRSDGECTCGQDALVEALAAAEIGV